MARGGAAPGAAAGGAGVTSWRQKDAVDWSAGDVRAFLEEVLPRHPSNERLGHVSGRCLATMTKDQLRANARDDEASNVIWSELQRLQQASREREGLSAHGVEPFTIFVRTIADVAVEVEVRPTDSVESLKSRVERLEGTPVDAQRIMWNGVPMLDTRTLASYGLIHGSRLLLVPKLAGMSQRYAQPPSAAATLAAQGCGATSAAAAAVARGGSRFASGLPRPRVPVVCSDIARPFPMSLEFDGVAAYQSFMLALQREGGRHGVASGEAAPFLEILPADNMRSPVQTRIRFDAEAEVLLIDTVGDIVLEAASYGALLHLRQEQKMVRLVTGLMPGR
eukprot:TRINITY_DN24668_c0_g1_i1.p1 TRINITY_DN24668_c0_g1~~TRINITY_DN24668_c0_g1_i1.p1  ORF type:complete len:349 (-),score=90.66 TRINITY_DN24668_c0_g1_i1:99-1106(-)